MHASLGRKNWPLSDMVSNENFAELFGEKDVAIAALQDFLKAANGDDRRGEVALRIAALNSK